MGMQVCMDSSDWLQGVINDESAGAMDSAISSPSGDNMLACAASRPVMERRLRPQHDQALKCPRCESTHTKFCYYNNYSLSQPRYFCKTCRRYWTKGGTLRNIPVGGGCRKNKKVTAKKQTNSDNNQAMISQNSSLVSGASSSLPSIYGPNDLHLTFPELQLSHMYGGSLGSSSTPQGSSFLESKFQSGTRPIDFLESKFDHHHSHQAVNIDDATRSQNFLGNGMIGDMNNASTTASPFQPSGSFFNGLGSSFGISSSSSSPSQYGNAGGLLDTCQRLMLPSYDYQVYDEDHHHHHHHNHHHGGGGDAIDVKPLSSKLLSLDWQDHHHHQPHQSCLNGVGPWSGMMNMNPYGPPSTTNPLV